jgi:glycerol dehydrogenase-like iron-containing ADH family enzyme
MQLEKMSRSEQLNHKPVKTYGAFMTQMSNAANEKHSETVNNAMEQHYREAQMDSLANQMLGLGDESAAESKSSTVNIPDEEQ